MYNNIISLAKRLFARYKRSIVKDWQESKRRDEKYISNETSKLAESIVEIEFQLEDNSYNLPQLTDFSRSEDHSYLDQESLEALSKRHMSTNEDVFRNLSRYKNSIEEYLLKEYFETFSLFNSRLADLREKIKTLEEKANED